MYSTLAPADIQSRGGCVNFGMTVRETIPIKSYSPELMVAPVYKASEFDSLVKHSNQQSEDAE